MALHRVLDGGALLASRTLLAPGKCGVEARTTEGVPTAPQHHRRTLHIAAYKALNALLQLRETTPRQLPCLLHCPSHRPLTRSFEIAPHFQLLLPLVLLMIASLHSLAPPPAARPIQFEKVRVRFWAKCKTGSTCFSPQSRLVVVRSPFEGRPRGQQSRGVAAVRYLSNRSFRTTRIF